MYSLKHKWQDTWCIPFKPDKRKTCVRVYRHNMIIDQDKSRLNAFKQINKT